MKLRTLAIPVLALSTLAAASFGCPDADARAELLAEEQIDFLTDEDRRQAVHDELHALNPEWDFMHRTFLALALVDRGLARPAEAARMAALVDGILAETLADEARGGHRYFLLSYAGRRPFRDSGRSVFVDGEIALVLGARRFLGDHPELARAHRERVRILVDQFRRSPALLPESYPDEAWLFCNTNALVAVVMADALDGSDHGDLVADWVARARAHLVEPQTGLLGAEYTWDGGRLDGPEGSSVWLTATNLLLLDEGFAREQYALARSELVRSVLGLGYAREWGSGWEGVVDVDSGPLVPWIEASPSSSGFALLASRAFEDDATFASLARSLHAADGLTRLDPRLGELADNPMGDVIVLHALTFGPLWREVRQRSGH
jgi:hypothetical protein